MSSAHLSASQLLSSPDSTVLRLLQQGAASGEEIVLSNGEYRIEFDAAGALQGIFEQVTNQSLDQAHTRGTQFKLNTRVDRGAWQEQALDEMVLVDDGRTLLVGDSQRQLAFVFEVDWRAHYLRLDLQRICAPDTLTLGNLYFHFYVEQGLKLYALDYMTQVHRHGSRHHAEIPWLWGVEPGEQMGSFALIFAEDEVAEDEALLHLWVDGWLPQPKVEGEWTLERARSWLTDWQARYVDQSTMIVQPQNPEEMITLCKRAVELGMRRIYLHTDVWRGEYWPRKLSFLHVNREIFPRGEEDLKRLSEALLTRGGIGLAVHTVSLVIGGNDPDYTKDGLDPRLAKWVEGEVVEAFDAHARTIRIRPKNRKRIPTVYEGGIFGPDQHYPFINLTGFQVGSEFVHGGEIREVEPGVWELTGCHRAVYETEAVAHAVGTPVTGYCRPYRQAFTADVESSLFDEVITRFGEFFNRVGLSHLECDGLENHLSVPWGRSKFSWLLYQQVDHPTTSNTSSGRSLQWHIDYWFNSSAAVRANHPTGGVAGGDGVPLYVHHASRPATGPYEIHLKPTDRLGLGGESVHFMRPIPMFGVSVEALDTHGLSGMFMDTIRLWKEALRAIPASEREAWRVPYTQSKTPFALRRAMDTLYRPVETVSGLSLQPFQAVQPVDKGIPWAWIQEGGPNVPRSFMQVGGESVDMDVPNGGDGLEFTLRVLPSFNSEDACAVKPGGIPSAGGGLTEIEQAYVETGTGLVPSGDEGSDSGAGAFARSVVRSLMPTAETAIRAQGAHQLSLKDGSLHVLYQGDAASTQWHADRPYWRGMELQTSSSDGLRLVVYGDGSGATLVVTLHGHGRRDYVFPIDFTGRRELLIPASYASWSQGDWGFRRETTHYKYAAIRQVELGFGQVPAGTAPRVTVESLDLVPGYRTEVNKLSLMLGDGALQIDGPVYTDEYVWYRGGDVVEVYDLNWNLRRSIPLRRRGFEFDAGTYPLRFWSESTQPYVELQMVSFGEPIEL